MASYFYTNFIFALLHALFVIQALKFSHSNALTNVSCIGAEREVLLKFKQNLTDPLRCPSLWTGKHCCEWDGVKCNNRTSHILELDLQGCDLGGKVLPALSELKHLKYLRLGWNNFIGHLPSQFGDFKDLEILDLGSNLILGPIPTTMGQLSSLRYLFLLKNNLSGNIPKSIGQLSNLIEMDFHNNRLDGVVSELHLENLTNLIFLALSMNELVINVIASWVPPFQLYTIYLSSCEVGLEFPNWLRTQRNIWSLHMSNSGIVGEIPHWLPDVLNKTEELDLSSNMLRGNIFQIVGKKTPRLFQLSLSGSNLSGDISNFTCMFDGLFYLDLSKNQLSGRLSPCWGLRNNLNGISLSDNKLNGQFPNYLCELKNLQVLGLHKNGLNGVLPECLIGLSCLEILDLSDNLFTSRIPPFSGGFKVINLERNYFTGDILGQLCHNSELQYLSLAHNNLYGGVPPCFSDFLQMWANSSFGWYPMDVVRRLFFVMVVNIKGISLEFTTSLQYLFSIDLSSNALEGQIPKGLTRLVQLQNLNLSQNKLIGKIPLDIGNLRYLESLDLSNNKLLGEIPPSISNLYFLSRLDLSFNNLSSPIPSGNQLSTLDDQSVYRGNHALCGAPLLKVCLRDEHNEGDSEGDSVVNWFYLGLGSGFAVALMGFCGILHVNRSWKIYYFRMVDRTIEKLSIGRMITMLWFKRAFQLQLRK